VVWGAASVPTCRVRTSLLAGVSSLALVIAGPGAGFAGDLPPRPAIIAKAPPAIQNKWTWWVEGGAAYLNGDPGVPGFNAPFDVTAKKWGWEAAAGFDYRFDNAWHVSAQFRYGRNKAGSSSSNPLATFDVFSTFVFPTAFTPIPIKGSNTAQHEESHWLADFMVGRDLGLGRGLPSTLGFGVRVAEIRGKTTGSAQWNNIPTTVVFATICSVIPTPAVCVTHKRDYTQYNNFFGAGPRIEVDGSIPLAPRWSIDYMGGLAGLYGRRSAIQKVNISQTSQTYFTTPLPAPLKPTCVSGCPLNAAFTDHAWVVNADAMIGLSYALTPNIKATLSYRFDGYWNALKAFDRNGQVTNLNRFYQGAMLRLTASNGDTVDAAANLALAPAIQNKLAWWVEGAAVHSSGDSGVAGMDNPPFDVTSKQWGWEAAAGFDYRLDSVWHVSAQFRYGRNNAGSNSNAPRAVFDVITTFPTTAFTPIPITGGNTAQHKESHWLADFMVGRDLGLGQGLPSTLRFGVRVAEIRSKTTGSAQWNNVPTTGFVTCTASPSLCAVVKNDYTQDNSFLGAGPRLEIDGSISLAPRWSIDYMGGVAGLYGRRTAVQTVNINHSATTAYPTSPFPPQFRANCVAGCPVNAAYTDSALVFNADAMVGLSYAITQNIKATVSYRFDGYWNALKTFDSNGQVTNVDRFYQGCMLRLTFNN
jgi:opacity protein-like surface antigen